MFYCASDETLDAVFWGILSGAIVGFSLLIYLPVKVGALRFRVKNNKLKDYRWFVRAYISDYRR